MHGNAFEIDNDELDVSTKQRIDLKTFDNEFNVLKKAIELDVELTPNQKKVQIKKEYLKYKNERYKYLADNGILHVQQGQIIVPPPRLSKWGLSNDTPLSKVFKLWTKKSDNTFDEVDFQDILEEKDEQGRSNKVEIRKKLREKVSAMLYENVKYTVGIGEDGKNRYSAVYKEDSVLDNESSPLWNVLMGKLNYAVAEEMKKERKRLRKLSKVKEF